MGCGCGKKKEITPPIVVPSTLETKATASLEEDVEKDLEKKDPEKTLAVSMLNNPHTPSG